MPRIIAGNIVDPLNCRIYPGELVVAEGRIKATRRSKRSGKTYILPGFIDAHLHIESSMLPPSEFARVAVTHGTVAAVSDPHEIANVLGVKGVKYMIENGSSVPFKFFFGAPSCVPPTPFETTGGRIGPQEIEELLSMDEIKFLGEMMNFPGVLKGDPEVMEKIEIAKRYSKPVDGHAPGLRGEDLERYVNQGISTDHESTTVEEALEKIEKGMKILIREGSLATDFEELIPILRNHDESSMFSTDDKHPDDLLRGHINELVKRALNLDIDIFRVLKVASVNPVLHYKLDVGLLQEGDHADFIEVDNLEELNILRTFIDGKIVAEKGQSLIPRIRPTIVNNFRATTKQITDFALSYRGGKINVIEVSDGQLLTERLILEPKIREGRVVSDTKRDILKMVVVNRYKDARPAIGFVRNFGLKRGAIASSVAHDSHNIIGVGVSDVDMAKAVNLIIENRGGISLVSDDREMILPLPIGGIMSDEDYSKVALEYTRLNRLVRDLGSPLRAPYMTLSFMALLVIPRIRLSDKGLFDVERFEFIDLFS